MVFAVGGVAVGREGLSCRMSLGAHTHEPLPKLGEILRLGPPSERIPGHKGMVLTV